MITRKWMACLWVDINSWEQSKDILKLLWAEKTIKDTLKNNHIKLYNKLIKQDVENKIISF